MADNKAFLFDMDGVLADTETEWERIGFDQLLKEHFGDVLFAKVEVRGGVSIKGIFDLYVAAGWSGDYEPFEKKCIEMGERIYGTIPLTEKLNELIKYLAGEGYKIGVVSSSLLPWVKTLVDRIAENKSISLILSVNNHPTLKSKPAPDPYIHAMEKLGVKPEKTIILEDSQTGVTAAKASGAHVICFTEYHHGYDWQPLPENADYYAKDVTEVREIVAKLSS
ncbi:HAD family phosphatase [Candidatus Woesebacteria bacterium]|nr:HAD family phosphatase [Candidatus Woesebacteria bacterium]